MNKPFVRDWKEAWIDRMGLIVALSGGHRFNELADLKQDMARNLSEMEQAELKEAIRMRFTPTNGQDGCHAATQAVVEVTSQTQADYIGRFEELCKEFGVVIACQKLKEEFPGRAEAFEKWVKEHS